MARGRYAVKMDSISVTAAKTLVTVGSPATAVLEVVRCKITTRATVSEASQVTIFRATTEGTNTTSTPYALGAYAASGVDGGVNHSVEPSSQTVLHSDGFNLVAGWEWVALDEEGRLVVPPSSFFGIELMVAPAGATVMSAMIEYIEKG